MLYARDFNLRYTVEGGQPLTFYSDLNTVKDADILSYPTSKGIIRLSHNRTSGRIRAGFSGSYTRHSAEADVSDRLGLNHNMGRIYAAINTDRHMCDAINQFYGMRITKSDPWEAALCFVVSQFNNIKRIRGIIRKMIATFGEDAGNGMHLFPTSESIAAADIKSIRACGTGFRDRYIKHVAEQFSSGFNPKALYNMKYEDAKGRLMELDGIGDKVADCILLFGYNKFEAFPIDVWVKRVMERTYFNGRKRSIRQIHEFSSELWGEYRGYAQQYIFESGRRNKKEE